MQGGNEMRWFCFCGKQHSNTLTPEPNGYDVFTSEEGENGYENPPKIFAYTCQDCGRIMVFKEDPETGMFEERFRSYKPEDPDEIDTEEWNRLIEEKARRDFPEDYMENAYNGSERRQNDQF